MILAITLSARGTAPATAEGGHGSSERDREDFFQPLKVKRLG